MSGFSDQTGKTLCNYIGASWPDRRDRMYVGNGGFSPCSARLLQTLTDDRFQVLSDACEDMLICRTWRPVLGREYDIRFSPGDVACFSYERDRKHWSAQDIVDASKRHRRRGHHAMCGYL